MNQMRRNNLAHFFCRAILIVLAPTAVPCSAGAQSQQSSDATRDSKPANKLDFSRDVRPILADKCFECHGPDAGSREADLRLDLRDNVLGHVVEPGDVESSELFRRIVSDDHDERMPPPESSRQLNKRQIQVLRTWIEQGATWDDHWSFQPLEKPHVPTVADSTWCQNEIDQFVLQTLSQNHLKPSRSATPEVLLRRLSLTLTGFPPTPAETDAFIAKLEATESTEQRDRVIENWVDGLMQRPSYGEHMAWAWLDSARYADTDGYGLDTRRVMWPWRDWLINALNRNLPFDEMTRQMLAGDLMIPAGLRDWESGALIRDDDARRLLTASGFLRNHRYARGSSVIPAESKFENATDRMETVGTVWLGLTMQCCRCHDHKFDPLASREYYQMLAFFDKVPEFGSAIVGNSHPYIRTPNAPQRAKLTVLDDRVEAARRALDAAESQIAQQQRVWEQSLNEPNEAIGEAIKVAGKDDVRVSRGIQFRFATGQPDGKWKPTSGKVALCDAPHGSGLQFDGQTKLTGPEEPIEMCAGAKQWSVSLWFRVDDDRDQSLFSSVQERWTNRRGLHFDLANKHLRIRRITRWNFSYIELISKQAIKPGVWTHITLVCDGRMQGIGYRAFIDGEKESFRTTHEVTGDYAEQAAKAPLVLGGGYYLPNLNGALADLRFYDRELGDVEVGLLAEQRSLSSLAAKAVGDRSAREKSILRLASLEHGLTPELKALHKSLVDAQTERNAFVRKLPTTMVMHQDSSRRTHFHPRGAYDMLEDPIDAQTPAILPPLNWQDKEPPDRLALANWLIDSRAPNPLTSRIAVNRIWQQLFGRGLVETPENFGAQCPQPVHSDLLDWLATEYIRLGWDTRALIKLIVGSATWQQTSTATPEHRSGDPENILLSRGPRYRLPIGVIRDQALFASGRLDAKVGGPSVLLDRKKGKSDRPFGSNAAKNDRRRTIYTFWRRNSPHPLLAVFDVADRNACEVRVKRTNTPLQALVGLNEPSLQKCCVDMAERIEEHEGTRSERLTWAFRTITATSPSADEKRMLSESFDRYHDHFQTHPDQAIELVGKSDNSSHDAIEKAAWATLANVLFNLDKTQTLE